MSEELVVRSLYSGPEISTMQPHPYENEKHELFQSLRPPHFIESVEPPAQKQQILNLEAPPPIP